MPAISFDAVRAYNEDRFTAREVFRTDRAKVVCGYFEPGQFIPVHAPDSDVVVDIRTGAGLVREGETEHHVEQGDVVVVEAGTARGIRATGEERFEALLVTTPPPTDEEHDPVRWGLEHDEFEPPLDRV